MQENHEELKNRQKDLLMKQKIRYASHPPTPRPDADEAPVQSTESAEPAEPVKPAELAEPA